MHLEQIFWLKILLCAKFTIMVFINLNPQGEETK